MRKNSFSGSGGFYEPTNQPTTQPRLGFFCNLEAKLSSVSEFVFHKISGFYSLVSARFSSVKYALPFGFRNKLTAFNVYSPVIFVEQKVIPLFETAKLILHLLRHGYLFSCRDFRLCEMLIHGKTNKPKSLYNPSNEILLSCIKEIRL